MTRIVLCLTILALGMGWAQNSPALPSAPAVPEASAPAAPNNSPISSQGSDFTVTLITKVPEILGISPEQFSEYRKQGLSLAQIAEEQGQTLEQVQGRLEEIYNQRVDQAANSGEILPQEAAILKENTSDTIDSFVNDSLGPVTVPK